MVLYDLSKMVYVSPNTNDYYNSAVWSAFFGLYALKSERYCFICWALFYRLSKHTDRAAIDGYSHYYGYRAMAYILELFYLLACVYQTTTDTRGTV